MQHYLLYLAFLSLASASPLASLESLTSNLLASRQQTSFPNSYFAFGDSYASGPGAGKFYHPEDKANKACKRFTGSYPAQLMSRPLFSRIDPSRIKFTACLGAPLSDIPRQRDEVGNQRAQIITISIGGNDFDFGPSVRACAYNENLLSDRDKDCDKALTAAETKLADDRIWNHWIARLREIRDNHLATDGPALLIVTGYPRFFESPSQGDYCTSHAFPIWGPLWGPNLRPIVRNRMNAGVDQLNTRISQAISSLNDTRIKFIHTDALYSSRGFCRPDAKNDKDAFGEDSPNIWITTLWEDFQESDWVDGPQFPVTEYWRDFIPGVVNNTKGLLPPGMNLLQVNSAFHPKSVAHERTASVIEQVIVEYARDNGVAISA